MEKRLIVEKKIVVNASAENLWAVLTESPYTQEYMFNCSVTTSWCEGDPILWHGVFQGYEANQKGVVLVYDPYKEISYTTFDPNFGLPDEEQNYIRVTYILRENSGETELTIRNETFDGSEERLEHIGQGWDMVLDKLKNCAERVR